ncbi:hypothetical protein OH76DRAFT_536549 [Lentinus brumalis]|uniref:Uncharacterized protein n=1 Tax=Lentinus brumalis TaxID=2498619 RepID=A0A371DAH0_9APHY|nr:hypothetical protein OH76DRAFT_536549 [Polyporus brumalis]
MVSGLRGLPRWRAATGCRTRGHICTPNLHTSTRKRRKQRTGPGNESRRGPASRASGLVRQSCVSDIYRGPWPWTRPACQVGAGSVPFPVALAVFHPSDRIVRMATHGDRHTDGGGWLGRLGGRWAGDRAMCTVWQGAYRPAIPRVAITGENGNEN